jgi:hypothetical protein
VVINLGTNDISNGKGDPGMPFRDTYRTLLGRPVRAYYPHTYIVCYHRAAAPGSGEAAAIGAHYQGRGRRAQRPPATRTSSSSPDPAADLGQGRLPVPPERPAENMLMADLLVTELKANARLVAGRGRRA